MSKNILGFCHRYAKKGSAILLIVLTIFTSMHIVLGASFKDVTDINKNYTAIEYIKENGMVSGYNDGTFKPENTINRAELTKIIIEATVENIDGENCFPDVKTEWFSMYVCTAKNLDIVSGYPDGFFRPKDTVSFAEAAKILGIAYEYATEDNQDVWYESFVRELDNRGAIPYTIKSFDHKITRGEISEIIYRLDAKISNKNSMTYASLSKTPILEYYFDNDPIAKKILAGEITYNMKDVGIICGLPFEKSTRHKGFGEKIVNGIKQLGYSFKKLCGNNEGPHMAVNILNRFQRIHRLNESSIIDKELMEILDSELNDISERDYIAAKDFPCFENLAPAPARDASKNHLAFLYSIGLSVFPEKYQMEKVHCANSQIFYGDINEDGLICPPLYWTQYMQEDSGIRCELGDLPSPFFEGDIPMVIKTIHEYSHFIEKYGLVDASSFYEISFDWDDTLEPDPTFGWIYRKMKPNRPFYPDGIPGIPYDEWKEMREHFLAGAARFRVDNDEYSGLSPEELAQYTLAGEDFAITMTMYILQGGVFREYMKDKPPLTEKYNWIKNNVFDGKEFKTGNLDYKQYAPDPDILFNMGDGAYSLYQFYTDFQWDYMIPQPVSLNKPNY